MKILALAFRKSFWWKRDMDGWRRQIDRQTESPIRLAEGGMKRSFSRGYNELQVSTQPQLFTEGKSGNVGMSRGVGCKLTHTHILNTVC